MSSTTALETFPILDRSGTSRSQSAVLNSRRSARRPASRLRRDPHHLHAGDRCIELKSLKYYFIEFRNRGIFYEAVTNQILDDLVAACHPRRMTVVGDFSVRGGIKTVVTATYSAA
jgi:hypothetical protein